MSGARGTLIAFAAATILGLVLWTGAAMLGHRHEPWDSPDYWTLAYPAAVILSGALGFVFPERPWRWPLALMFMQLPVMILGGSDFSLLPLGLILMAVLALPGIGLAYLCAWVRGQFLGE
jgi:hypothetical protein